MLFDMRAMLPVVSFPKTLFVILFVYQIVCLTLSNSIFLLHYCISLYSASSILLHLFFCSFLFLFTMYVLFLPKDRNYLPQHVHLKRVHTLCMNYGHSIIIFVFIYMRTIPNLFEHYTIVLLSFTFTYLGLLSYLYNRRLLPLWADLVCQPVQRLLYLYTYLYYSNCNMLLTASYLISLLAHAIYLTYLVKLYILSNVCILDFTPLSYCTSVNRAVAYGARCCIGVLWHRSGSACPAAGVCDAFVSSRMHVCVCGRRAACMRLKPDPVYCTNLNGT